MKATFKYIVFIMLFMGVEIHFNHPDYNHLSFSINTAFAFSCSGSSADEQDDDCIIDEEIETIEVIGERIENDWNDDWDELEFEDFLEELIEQLENDLDTQIEMCERSAFENVDDCTNNLKDLIGYAADACYISAGTLGGVVGIYLSPMTGVVVGGLSASACLAAKIYDTESAPGHCVDQAKEEAEACS